MNFLLVLQFAHVKRFSVSRMLDFSIFMARALMVQPYVDRSEFCPQQDPGAYPKLGRMVSVVRYAAAVKKIKESLNSRSLNPRIVEFKKVESKDC